MSSKLIESIINLEEDESIEIAKQRIDSGEDPLNILNDVRKDYGISRRSKNIKICNIM